MVTNPEIGTLYKFTDTPTCDCTSCTGHRNALVEVIASNGINFKLYFFDTCEEGGYYPRTFIDELLNAQAIQSWRLGNTNKNEHRNTNFVRHGVIILEILEDQIKHSFKPGNNSDTQLVRARIVLVNKNCALSDHYSISNEDLWCAGRFELVTPNA